MDLENITPGMRVVYIPLHAHGDRSHEDCEYGTVSSKNQRYVFVRFDRVVAMFGWQGATSEGCDPKDLKEA